MRRGPKPAKSKEAKPPVGRKSPKNGAARVSDLEKRLAEALKREAEALDQQKTTSEILRVISRSPTNLQPVLDAIATNAALVCDAYDAIVFLREGDHLRTAAHYGPITITLPHQRSTLSRGSVTEAAILDRQPVHVHDVLGTEPPVFPLTAEAARRGGFRTVLSVPLLRENEAIGALAIRRREVQPFTTQQIDLLKTFADQGVIAIENVRLFNETKEALERQTATSEILRVISSSPTDLQPVMNTVAENAARLCDAIDAQIFRIEGGLQVRVASYGSIPNVLSHATPPNRGLVTGRAILERRTIHVHDLAAEVDREYPDAKSVQQITGQRTTLATPLLREGEAIGVILIRRREVRPFTDKQIALLETFADEAVIAIENVRLFKELESKNRALTEAHAQVTESLEQQTATSEILSVISSSPTDVQPVFDTIAANAARLCAARDAQVLRVEGDVLRLVSAYGSPSIPPVRSISRGYVVGRAVIDRQTIHVRDMTEAVTEFPQTSALQHGVASILAVPLLRQDVAVGAIRISRTQVQPFTDAEIALLQTFADQAVIAIENVRLFKELEARNRDLTEALERQTATSEILNVISASPTDVHPVFAAVCKSAVRLFGAYASILIRFDGQLMHFGAVVSVVSPSAEADERYRLLFPRPPDRELGTGRAILDRAIVHVPDTERDTERNRELGRDFGYRRLLVVPMMRGGEAIGALAVTGREPGSYSDWQIELLKTFADQAVIAIENVRLFKELEARNQELTVALAQQTATSEVLAVISGAQTDVQPVFEAIVQSARRLCDASYSSVYRVDGQLVHLVAHNHQTPEAAEAIRGAWPMPLTGDSFVVRAIRENAVIHTDMQEDPTASAALMARGKALGHRRIVVVPMVREGKPIGAIRVSRVEATPFAEQHIALLKTFADQAVIAVENVRLFKELEEANRELSVASQHKSEFLANMSHELRTPLNAIIGFSEVLSERMFGELNEKQEEYLKDIYASGTHLLSLINDILDLSKIEAGRMELELTDFHLLTALDNALTLVRERAGRRNITLQMSVDERLGEVRADERKVRQVVLNLLSNAIKFTPEGGRIEVGAVTKDGVVEVSVSDTGVGIAPEDQEAIFEEFRQVGTADKKVEGTGLGLTLCRKFVELHGGRIWVTSQVGAGSTFTFTIPVRRGE